MYIDARPRARTYHRCRGKVLRLNGLYMYVNISLPLASSQAQTVWRCGTHWAVRHAVQRLFRAHCACGSSQHFLFPPLCPFPLFLSFFLSFSFFFTPDDDSQSSVIVIQPTDNGANTTHAAPQIETFYDEFQQTVSTSTPLEVMYSDH